MADSDILYKDGSASPQSFYPEAKDVGNNVRRTMVGVKDGADEAQGAKADGLYTDITGAANGTLVGVSKSIFAAIGLRSDAAPATPATAGGLLGKISGVWAALLAMAPGGESFAITPSDSAANNFATAARSVYVGTAGDVTIVTPGGTAVLFKNAPAGSVLPQRAIRVNATGTTASNMVGIG